MGESDLSMVPSELIRISICETIEKQLNSKEYEIEFVSSVSKAGESNFVGIVHRVSFTKEDPNEKERRSASRLILKVAPQNGFSAVYGIPVYLQNYELALIRKRCSHSRSCSNISSNSQSTH